MHQLATRKRLAGRNNETLLCPQVNKKLVVLFTDVFSDTRIRLLSDGDGFTESLATLLTKGTSEILVRGLIMLHWQINPSPPAHTYANKHPPH